MPELNERFFESLKTLRPLMEEYNSKLIAAFEAFLKNPSQDALRPVFNLQNDSLATPSSKCYEYVNMIFTISDLALKELIVGFSPITQDTFTYTEAIDKYHKTVFMARRHIFMAEDKDPSLLDEAAGFILSEGISPVTLSYIINNEHGEPVDDAILYWTGFFRLYGREQYAVMLSGLQAKVG